MKMLEEIKYYKKEFVYETYTRVVPNIKGYDKITKVKMLEEIYKVYSDYKNIIDICTTKELKFLKMAIDNDPKCVDDKYEWERNTLRGKFIINYHIYCSLEIPEEIKDNIEKAVKNINFKESKLKDEINEILVSICKIHGSMLIQPLIQIGSGLLNMDPSNIAHHIINNKVFNYYVFIASKEFEGLGNDIPTAIFHDYYYIFEELEKQRKIQGKAFNGEINIEDYKSLFYNDFNMNNPIIKKFYNELNKLPIYIPMVIDDIKEYSLLNVDRKKLKKSISSIPNLSNYDLTDFFEVMDKAMDEMPSGALNGLTPNELKNIKREEKEFEIKRSKKYIGQQNACLSKKEAKLFYKLYFGLLDFTNRKFNIRPNYKIYNQLGINPYEISDIVEKFWEYKDAVIIEFCMANPFKFNVDEIKMVQEFRKGFRDTFVIVEYDKEYTALMDMNTSKTYMIKGINSNIDEVIPYNQLPQITMTSIMPFNDKIIYDGLFMGYGVNFGIEFSKMVEKEFENSMKYYHL